MINAAHPKRRWLFAALFIALALAGVALAGGLATTGTVTACAHATTPAQTIAVNGNPISTVPGEVSDQCVTTTYTIPTVTVTTSATTTTTPTTTVLTPGSTVSNSLTAGSTLSGTYDWTVTTAGDVSSVEFWATNSSGVSTKLATVSGSGTFVFSFDTTKLANGSYLFGVVEDAPDGTRYKDSDRRTATISNTVAAPAGTVYFQADYESGGFFPWRGTQCEANNQLASCPSSEGDTATVQSTVVRQGRYAGRFHTGQSFNGLRERAQAYADQVQTDGYEGQEVWYGWSMYIEPGSVFAPNSNWNNLTSWHNTGPSCPAPDHFTVNTTGGTWMLHFDAWGGPLDATTCSNPYRKSWNFQNLQAGVWYDFVAHFKWSSDPNVGFVELFLNGKNILPKTSAATLYTGQGVYLKQGFDTGGAPGGTTIYNDCQVIASDYADAISGFPAGSWPSTAP